MWGGVGWGVAGRGGARVEGHVTIEDTHGCSWLRGCSGGHLAPMRHAALGKHERVGCECVCLSICVNAVRVCQSVSMHKDGKRVMCAPA